MSNSLDPNQAQHFVGPDLGPNFLQRLSADDISRQSDNLFPAIHDKYNLHLNLHIYFGQLYSKQYKPRSDCSHRGSLISVHSVSFQEMRMKHMEGHLYSVENTSFSIFKFLFHFSNLF